MELVMNRIRVSYLLGIIVLLVAAMPSARADLTSVKTLTGLIPADLPFVLVVENLEQFEAAASAFVKQIDPDESFDSPLSELKAMVPNGEWIDYSRPFAAAASAVGDEPSMFWAQVPDFAKKITTIEGAKEENGVWTVPAGTDACFAKEVGGGFLVISTSAEGLASATKKGASLADTLKGRPEILKDRGLLLHLELKAQRPKMLMGLQQAGMMAPMLAMQFAQGGDPTQVTNMITGLLQGLQRFVEQLDYVDITASVTKHDVRLTVASGFGDGPIKTFLANTKPGALESFRNIEGSSFAMAFDAHLPGGMGELSDYLMSKMFVITESDSDIAKMVANAKEIARLTDGGTTLVRMTDAGMKLHGAYRSSDASRLKTLMSHSLENPNPIQKQMAAGMTYEPAGTEKIGSTEVTKYALKFDEANPSAGQMQMLYGADAVFALGQMGDQVRFCIGSASDISKAFVKGTSSPLGASKFVRAALEALPTKQNGVILIDPVGFLPMIPPMFMPAIDTSSIGPGPVVGIGISLSGEPARLDVHVPVAAIVRVIQAIAPQEPM